MQIETEILGYAVSLDDMDGDGETTGCWISRKKDGKEYTASLQALTIGALMEASDGSYLAMPVEHIDTIETWALMNGY